MKIIKIFPFLVLVFIAQSLNGQTGWEWRGISNVDAFDIIVENEDSIFMIGHTARLNIDSTDFDRFDAIEFSDDGGDNWSRLIESDTASRFSAFTKRKQQIIVGGNRFESDSAAFLLVANLDFSLIDTIEIKEIKELKYFSKTDTENIYFVYRNQIGEFQIGLLEVESKNVILGVGDYASNLSIEQLYFFDSGVVYLRNSREIFLEPSRPRIPGEILKSKDFGVTWDSVSLQGNALSMDFINEKDGVYFQKNSGVGRVYMTHDGAESFNIVLDGLSLIWGVYRELKLLSEHTVVGTGSTGITHGLGPFADKFSDFQPFKLEQIFFRELSPPFFGPIVKSDSCLYILDFGFYRTCESSGLTNSNNLNTKQKIEIYPNPASNEITLKSPPDLSGNLKIYDSIGRFYFQQKLNSGETEISVDELGNGLYFLVHESLGTIGTFAVLK